MYRADCKQYRAEEKKKGTEIYVHAQEESMQYKSNQGNFLLKIFFQRNKTQSKVYTT